MRSISYVLCAVAFVWPVTADEKKDVKFDAAKLVGKWEFVSGEKPGEKLDKEKLKDQSVEFTKDSLILEGSAGKFVMKFEVDTKKTPVGLSLEITEAPFGKGSKSAGIIELDGDNLKICYADPDEPAPAKFEITDKSKARMFVLKRKK